MISTPVTHTKTVSAQTSTGSDQKKERAITIFLAGTSNTQQDSNEAHNVGPKGRYPHGEIVSILAANHQGVEGKDWFFMRGLGGRANNGGREETFPDGTTPDAFADRMQSMFALFWDKKISDTIQHLKAIIERHKEYGEDLPEVVNLVGWSRGAVTANMVANAMLKDPLLSHLSVNIAAFDPVPGESQLKDHPTSPDVDFNKHHKNPDITITGSNVKKYLGIYARDDRSSAFVPMVPITHPETAVELILVPGDHGTGAGRVRYLTEIENETGPEVGLIVRDKFEKQLTEWGVTFNNKLELTPEQIEIYREIVKKEDQKYLALRDRSKYPLLQQEINHGKAERSFRYGNYDEGHLKHGLDHTRGHVSFNEIVEQKGLAAVNGGDFFNGGYFTYEPETSASPLSEAERTTLYENNFDNFIKSISLSLDIIDGGRGYHLKNALNLRLVKNGTLHKKMISEFDVGYATSLDGEVFFNSAKVKDSIQQHLDFELDTFVRNAMDKSHYFLARFKDSVQDNLAALKEKVGEAVAARLIADNVNTFKPKNRPKELVQVTNTNTTKLVTAAEEKRKNVISSLVDAFYVLEDGFKRYDHDQVSAKDWAPNINNAHHMRPSEILAKVKESERLKRSDRAIIHDENFDNFFKNTSLFVKTVHKNGAASKNELTLQFYKDGWQYTRTIDGPGILDTSVLDKDSRIQSAIIEHLDSSLDNFVRHVLDKDDDVFNNYKGPHESKLNTLKEKVGEAVAARLVAKNIDFLIPTNSRQDVVTKHEMSRIANEKREEAINSLVDTEYFINDFHKHHTVSTETHSSPVDVLVGTMAQFMVNPSEWLGANVLSEGSQRQTHVMEALTYYHQSGLF